MVPTVLVIDDDPDDVQFVRRAFKKADLANPLLIASTVEQAQELCSTGPAPVLVILDVYLQGRSGLEFLEWLRAQPQPLCEAPVIVLSVSTDKTHQLRAQDLRTSLFLGKPATEEVLTDAVQAFGLVRTTAFNGSARRRWLASRQHPRKNEME